MHISRQRGCVREQTWLGVPLIDPMCIEKLEENEAEEQHFVEAKTIHKDVREENNVVKEKQPSIEVQLKVQQATKV